MNLLEEYLNSSGASDKDLGRISILESHQRQRQYSLVKGETDEVELTQSENEIYGIIENNMSGLSIMKYLSSENRKSVVNLLIKSFAKAKIGDIITVVENPLYEFLKNKSGLRWLQLQQLCRDYLKLKDTKV